MDNRIIFDWLSFRSRLHDVSEIFDMIGLSKDLFTNYSQDNVLLHGFYGYDRRYTLDNIINIHYCSADHPHADTYGVLLELTGQGCRYYEEFSTVEDKYVDIFKWVINNHDTKDCVLTRVDVAYDDFNRVLDMPTLIHDTMEGNYTCTSRSINISTGTDGSTIYFGNVRQSEFAIRIYDKVAERKHNTGKCDIDFWIRVEAVMKHDVAFSFIQNYLLNSSDIGKTFKGVLSDKLNFRVPSDDKNKSRWKICDYWVNFLGSVESIHLRTDVDTYYSIDKMENFIFCNSGNAIYAYIDTFGISAFIAHLMYEQQDKPTKDKYKRVLDACLQALPEPVGDSV